MKRHLPRIVSVLKDAGKPKFVVLGFDEFRQLVVDLDLPFEIDEARYLAENHDVRDAVNAGKFRNATEHYRKHGYFEGRPVRPAPTSGLPRPKLVSSR